MFSLNWKPGRKFTVNTNVLCRGANPYVFIAGRIYKIGDVAKQIVTPEGTYEFSLADRKQIYRRIIWRDGRISDSLKMFIEKHPESKYVRGFVRGELNIAPVPSETPTTTEGWMKFIKENYKGEEVGGVAPPANTMGIPEATGIAFTTHTWTPAPIPVTYIDRENVPIYCEFEEDVSVSTVFSRRDTLSATVPVPLDIVRDGIDAIRNYLYENVTEYCDRDPGEADDYRDEEIINSDGIELNLAQVDEAIESLDEETRRTIRWYRDREDAA
jgi:hypothetical protein